MSASKKMIESVKDAILTGTKEDSFIHERSFLSHLLENRRGNSFSPEKKGDCTGREWTSFVVTRWILRFIRKIITGALWIIHIAWYLIVRKNRSRVCKVWEAFQRWITKVKKAKGWKDCWKQVKNIDKQQIRSLLDVPSSPTINFCVIAAVFVLAIVFIVNMFTFAIKDIMFPPLNMRTNEQGVLTIDQPCMESHSFFLLNASTFWKSTGINVNKDDKVTFSISGSMYSDIGEMDSAANDNRKLLYPRACFAPNMDRPTSEDAKYCIYNKFTDCFCTQSQDARFGTLLCQVSDEHLPPSDPSRQTGNTIRQITSKTNSFTADNTGMLFLTFNDVLLNEDNVFNMLMDSSVSVSKMRKDLLDSDFFTFKNKNANYNLNTTIKKQIKRIYEKKANTYIDFNKYKLRKTINLFYTTAQPDPTIWFKDNAGEYLVNIRVERNIRNSNLSPLKKLAMSVLREFEHCLPNDAMPSRCYGFWHSRVPIMLGIILLYFIIDLLVSYLVQSSHRTENESSLSNN
jgi:hypothetical protein